MTTQQDYTVQSQYSTDDGETWLPFREATDFEYAVPDLRIDDIAWSLDILAQEFEDEGLPQGAIWRIAAWRGLGADTSKEPDFYNGPHEGPGQEVMTQAQAAEEALRDLSYAFGRDLTPDGLLKELGDIRDMLTHLSKRRDAAIRMLMKTDTKRKKIAEASGVKEARLYQIVNEGRGGTAA